MRPEQRAEEIYENGSTLYAEGLYEDAIAAWVESYRLSGLHEILLNIANAYERLQRFEDAIAVLNRYRAYAHREEREQLKNRIAALRERVDRLGDPTRPPVRPLPIPPLVTPEAVDDPVMPVAPR